MDVEMMTDKEAERLAESWLQMQPIRFTPISGKLNTEWRSTWAEYVVRGATPEPIMAEQCPTMAQRARAIGPVETYAPGRSHAERFIVHEAWATLTEDARKAYREAFSTSMKWSYDLLKDWRTQWPMREPQVTKAAAMFVAASNIQWDQWYPVDAKFYAQVEPYATHSVSVTAWMWPN